MDTITLRSDLQAQLEKSAKEEAKTINDLVNEAVEQYLREQRRTKLDHEVVAYEQMHGELKQRYLGQWVALHHGQLVDRDTDGPALYRRIRAQYGRISVLIRQVADQPIEEVWLRTPTIGRVTL